jgi:pyruvate,orthophosphate dikinase
MYSQWFLVIWEKIVQQVLYLQETPSDGLNEIYGEYLINAQGEDVVAGTRTPQYITKKARQQAKVKAPSMEEVMPDVYKQLHKILKKLEKHYKDMQDVEFTVENKKLWMLQT